MKIIDTNTGKRLDKKEKVEKNIEKELEQKEYSPMDPPEAYEVNPNNPEEKKLKARLLLEYIELNNKAMPKIDLFEKELANFKQNGYQLTEEINSAFGDFFQCFDEEILPRHDEEEKKLFPILRKKLLKKGEHSIGEKPKTAIDLMEDDHIKFIQLASLAFNLLGLATRLPEPRSRLITFDLAFNNAKELTELIKLHFFREENTLFPIAQDVIHEKEFEILDVD